MLVEPPESIQTCVLSGKAQTDRHGITKFQERNLLWISETEG